jgi:multiple sugar transport system substrate-binding protein
VLAALAPRAVDLCRFDGVLLSAPRLVDVRIMWVRTDRVAAVPDTWTELLDSDVTFGFPGRESGLFGTFFELVVGAGGALFDADRQPTMATPEAEWAIDTLCRLAARAPDDLPDWHYDGVDTALLAGRIDAAGAWPGGWGAIRDSDHASDLAPFLYPAGSARRVSYSGCHSWAIPTTCGDVERAAAVVTELLGEDAQALDASGGNLCAHVGALAAVPTAGEADRRRLELTRATIEDSMITYPPLADFPSIEDAGWSAIRDALLGRTSPRAATQEIQRAATAVRGRD